MRIKDLIIYTASLAVILTSCRKEEMNQMDGPNLNDIYGEFGILSDLEASQTNVDFAAGEQVYFSCQLAKISEWKLQITGQSSGAVKIISGISKSLDQETAFWDGSTTEFPVFTSEVCEVQLTFEGEPDTLNTTVTVSQPKVNEGFVIADFESGWMTGWTTFIQSGQNMDFNIKSDGTAPQSSSYYNMQGLVNWDWLVGLVDFKAQAYGDYTLPLTSNGDNLYFNALLYGEAGLPNSRVLFRFDEDDDEDGAFEENSEDQYGIEYIIDWEGWRLVSIKYSDLEGNGNGGGNHNPDRLNKVSVLHLANPSSGFAKSGIDYLIFTENGPLNP